MQVAVRDNGESLSDRVHAFLDLAEVRPIRTGDEREAVFRLRYEAYLREGVIRHDFTRRLTDRFDEAANVWLFGVYVDGILASSIRVHVASPEFPESPGTTVFWDVLKPELEKGSVIVDPTRFVADPYFSRMHPELPYATVRLGFLACGHVQADLGLATVRPEHQAFYRRLFGLRSISEPRMYPMLLRPHGLMAAHLPSVRAHILSRYPFLEASEEELGRLFSPAPEHRSLPHVREPAIAQPAERGRGRPGARPLASQAPAQAERRQVRPRISDS